MFQLQQILSSWIVSNGSSGNLSIFSVSIRLIFFIYLYYFIANRGFEDCIPGKPRKKEHIDSLRRSKQISLRTQLPTSSMSTVNQRGNANALNGEINQKSEGVYRKSNGLEQKRSNNQNIVKIENHALRIEASCIGRRLDLNASRER